MSMRLPSELIAVLRYLLPTGIAIDTKYVASNTMSEERAKISAPKKWHVVEAGATYLTV